jgi:hypothetical protein
MRKALIYLLLLALAATAVFFSTYFLGRHSTLEAELERLTAPRAASPPAGKERGIPSLQPAQPPAEAVPATPAEPGAQPLGEGMIALRSPLSPPGMVVVADLPALAAAPARDGAAAGAALAAFLRQPPSGLRVGARALAGAPDDCGATDQIAALSAAGATDLAVAFDRASGRGLGPRNLVKAVEAAATDLASVDGERVVVVIAGGAEGCGADLCGSAPPPGGSEQRVHVVLLAPPPQSGEEPGLPAAAGAAALPAPVFEPEWAAPYRCLAERTGGTIEAATGPAQLESALRRIAGRLESAVAVRAFHYTGQELRGISPDGQAGWGATVRAAGGTPEAPSPTLDAGLFPAAFAVPAGVYIVKSRYCGQEKTAAVAVGPGERAEVRVTFSTGELFVRALDAAGGEISGDSTGFRCAWGADVFAGEAAEEKNVASTCTLPVRLELAPGVYRVRVRWKGLERLVEEVTVEAGASAVRTVSFGSLGE